MNPSSSLTTQRPGFAIVTPFRSIPIGPERERTFFKPRDRGHRSFGFYQNKDPRNPRTEGRWLKNPRFAEEYWTEFFLKILSHPYTRMLAPHQYNEAASRLEPRLNPSTLASIRREVESMRNCYGPGLAKEAREIIVRGEKLVVGRITLHYLDGPATEPNTYRMADPNVRYDGSDVLDVSWELISELGTQWLRDVQIEDVFPWAAIPWGVSWPNVRLAFVGNFLRPNISLPQPVARSPIAVTVHPATTDPIRGLVTVGRILHALISLVGPTDDHTLRALLNVLDPALGGMLSHLTNQRKLSAAGLLATVRLVAETTPFDIDELESALRPPQALEREAAEAHEKSEIARMKSELEASLAAHRELLERLRQLRDEIEQRVAELFAPKERELLELQARVRAQAEELDRVEPEIQARQAALSQLATSLEAERTTIRELEQDLVRREGELGTKLLALSDAEKHLAADREAMDRREFALSSREANIGAAEAAQGKRLRQRREKGVNKAKH